MQIAPILTPFLNSSHVTVYTKFPKTEAVHEMVPVNGSIEKVVPEAAFRKQTISESDTDRPISVSYRYLPYRYSTLHDLSLIAIHQVGAQGSTPWVRLFTLFYYVLWWYLGVFSHVTT